MNQVIPPCPECGAKLIEKQKKRPDGTDNVFYTCPNWKPKGLGCKGFIFFPESQPAAKPARQAILKTQDEQILTEIALIHKRIDELASYLQDKLG